MLIMLQYQNDQLVNFNCEEKVILFMFAKILTKQTIWVQIYNENYNT